MKPILFFLLFSIFPAGAMSSEGRVAADDSLADCFPLNVGYQWLYQFDARSTNETMQTYYVDTGTVRVQVTGSILAADSTRWQMRQTMTRWSSHNGYPFTGPYVQEDSFEVIERDSGRHMLYRTGEPVAIRWGPFAFQQGLPDTDAVYRYMPVDSGGRSVLWVHAGIAGDELVYTFKEGVGLDTLKMSSGLTCLVACNNYGVVHYLREAILTEVRPPSDAGQPCRYSLSQNYPNPFNPTTTFSFAVPARSFVTLHVFDLMGRNVATIVSEVVDAGMHMRHWDATGLASGVYYYRLMAEGFVATRALVLLK